MQNRSWDQIDDGYFAEEDRAEIRDEAMRVRLPAPAAHETQHGAGPRRGALSSCRPPAGAGGGGPAAGGAAGRRCAVAPLQHRHSPSGYVYQVPRAPPAA